MISIKAISLKKELYSTQFLRKSLTTLQCGCLQSLLVTPTRSILMDKDLYPDGKLFNTARWLEPDYPTYKEPSTTYPNCQGFPAFGYGRRACPGVDFAERTLVIMFAKLGWKFNIRWPMDANGNGLREKLQYEPVPAPRPLKFRCELVARDADRTKIAEKAARHLNLQ